MRMVWLHSNISFNFRRFHYGRLFKTIPGDDLLPWSYRPYPHSLFHHLHLRLPGQTFLRHWYSLPVSKRSVTTASWITGTRVKIWRWSLPCRGTSASTPDIRVVHSGTAESSLESGYLCMPGMRMLPYEAHRKDIWYFLRDTSYNLQQFHQMKRIISPYTSRLTVRGLVQLERITFRAILVLFRTALFVCSESDTLLMNYTIRDILKQI